MKDNEMGSGNLKQDMSLHENRNQKTTDELPEITPELLARLRDGDHDAFNTVYLASIENMLKFLYLLLHSEEDAEELAQHVFVYIWEHRDRINPGDNFKGYLYRVTKSKALRKISREKVERKYHDYVHNLSPEFSPSPDDLVTTNELAMMIKISLEKMPERQRKVFEMSRFEGKTTDEIARQLNMSPHTVRVHIHAATVKLKDLVSIFIILFLSQ